MRVHDWDARLAAVMAEAARRPFQIGTFDCAIFANDCAAAVLGRSPWAQLFGYCDAFEAYRRLRFAEGYFQALDDRAPRVRFAETMRGDLALVPAPDGRPALAVVDGARLVGPGPKVGLVAREPAEALGFWGLR